MDRYQFLSPPARLEELAVTELPGSAVFVLDARRVVHHVNEEASRLISGNGHRPAGLPLDEVFRSADDLHECLDAGDFLSGGCRWATVDVGPPGGLVRSMDVAVSTIASDDGVVLGYIVVGDVAAATPGGDPVSVLSSREREIVREVVRGASNADIAEQLRISERTVTTHLTRVFAKLGVHSRLELHALLSHHSTQQ
ncbi:MAG: hypothetical protein EA382_01730 [Spirochaetaceae bacterium]|nr:MAG: hypothetical protein EA382_01730 [Spirochaetaceae bacterium]